ncbi:MAG TPA: hypothetical protein VGE97_07525 [Nitrososphaera sp.]
MKLSRFNTQIFIKELEDLSQQISETKTQAETWIEAVDRRDKGMGWSQYHVQGLRMGLENRLNELREKLAVVYDFQGDRGMADFVPAGFNSNGKEEEESEDGVDPFDFAFFPNKKVSQLEIFFNTYYHRDRVYFRRNHG